MSRRGWLRTEHVVRVNMQPHTVVYIGYSFLVIESVGQCIDNDSNTVPVVMCEPQFNGNLTEGDYISPSLSLTLVYIVAIEGVHYEGCLRPPQFNDIIGNTGQLS